MHRLRELRGVSTISANAWPASQAQKSKSRCATACPRACATSSGRRSRTVRRVVLPPARHLLESPVYTFQTICTVHVPGGWKAGSRRVNLRSRLGLGESSGLIFPMHAPACNVLVGYLCTCWARK